MADEEDYSSLPLTERAVHKVWKVRQGAYDEMKKQFTSSGSESDGCFRPYLDNPGILKKVVTDSNVVAQETGVGALCAFLEFGGSNACLRTRSTVVGPLIEKALGSSRAGTKRNAVDALLWYIELDTPDPVVEDLVPFLSHKTPKLVVATTNGMTEIIRAFGAKTVNVKPVIPLIPKLFAHADKNVRAEANTLVIELYKWLGDQVSKLVLPDLKPVQQKELEEAFSKVSGETPHQQRYLKSQRDAMERQQASGIDYQEEEAGGQDDDGDEEMPDLVDPVAVLSKVPSDFEARLISTKWKDRKEALEELRVAFNVPKMEPEDFGDITRLLAKSMKDANIQVVIVAANCIEQLANGLKSNFGRYYQTVLGPMLERTKEKKANVTEALSNALDAVFKSVGMVVGEVLETTLENMKHKTPQVKIESTKFLIRCLKTTKTAPKQNEVKEIVAIGSKLLNETQEPVRAAGQEVFGVLMKIFGERAMNPHLDSVDSIKREKIQEYCDAAEVKAKPETAKPKPAAAAAPAAQKPVSGNGRKIAAPKKAGAATPGASAGSGAAAATAVAKTPKTLPQGSSTLGKKRLASPLKTNPQQRPAATERFSEEPPSPVAQTPASQNRARGLTGRSLQSAAQAQAKAAPPPPDPRLGMLEKEVEQLRTEKQQWDKEREQMQWKSQEEQGEKARLMQEINDLQLKNAQLVEDHTRDILAIKSKETQLVRAMSDVDTAKLRIQKLESELERLRNGNSEQVESGTRSHGAGSPMSPTGSTFSSHRHSQLRRSVDFSSQGFQNFNSKSPVSDDNKENAFASIKAARGLYDSTSRSSSSPKEESLPSHQEEEEKAAYTQPDHDGDSPMQEAPSATNNFQPPSRPAFQSGIPPPSQPMAPGENWKRAVEVTSQLRARIEAMKARQNRTK